MFTATWTPEYPDNAPHVGKTVVFVPNPEVFLGEDGSTTLGAVEGVIDTAGALKAKDGTTALQLKWKPGLQYQVRLVGSGLHPFWFDVETNVADLGTLDLSTVVPSAGAALVPTQYAELDARIDVLEAAPPGSAPDATTTSKGIVQLAGDLGGTAAAPTVPGLAGKAATVHTHSPADVTGTAVITTDPRLSDARTPTAHTHPASQISDSTATGRSVVTAADAAAARTAIGAGTSSLALGTTAGTALDASTAPELIRDTMGTALVAGSNVTITPNDAGDTITIAAAAPPVPTLLGGGVRLTNTGSTFGISASLGGFTFPHPISVTKIAVEVTTAVAAATGILVAYVPTSGTNLELLYNFGTIDASAVGWKTLTGQWNLPGSIQIWWGIWRTSEASGAVYRSGSSNLFVTQRDVNNAGELRTGLAVGAGFVPPPTISVPNNANMWAGRIVPYMIS